jgi:uncharacterized SAM-dependent methyltransferase
MSSASAEALGSLHDYVEYGHASGNFLEDVLNGLRRTPKRLPSKYFYDERGSQLFDDICELPEYYPTRTEMALLQSISSDPARCARCAAGLCARRYLARTSAGLGQRSC